MQIGESVAVSWNRQGKSNHVVAIECADHLTANFIGHHKETQRHQFEIAEVPYFPLKLDAGAKFIDPFTLADNDRVSAHLLRSCSCRLACCHSASSSSMSTLSGVRWLLSSCRSIY